MIAEIFPVAVEGKDDSAFNPDGNTVPVRCFSSRVVSEAKLDLWWVSLLVLIFAARRCFYGFAPMRVAPIPLIRISVLWIVFARRMPVTAGAR